jgi:hypothetical protein
VFAGYRFEGVSTVGVEVGDALCVGEESVGTPCVPSAGGRRAMMERTVGQETVGYCLRDG